MTAHMWVEIKYTPIVIEEEADGSLHVSATKLSVETADEDAQYGCWSCLVTLNTDSYQTECPGNVLPHPQP